MKNILSLIFVFYGTLVIAQMYNGTDTLYGNEWINYNQGYYKIKVAEDGLYKIDFQTLQQVGAFVNGIPQGSELQLFHNGEEIPLRVSNNNTLTNGDYFIFYGKKNRGEIDTYLYEFPEHQLNPSYSLFSDTSIYFLTWATNSSNHLRITNTNNNLSNPPIAETYCSKQKLWEYHNLFRSGRYYAGSADVSSKYDLGEGYCRSTFIVSQTFNISTPNYVNNNDSALFTVRFLTETGIHHTSIDINNQNVIDETHNGWAVKNYQINFPTNQLAASNPLKIEGLHSTDDRFRVASVRVDYPHSFDFENTKYFDFQLSTNNQAQYLTITNFNHGGVDPILYDLTNQKYITTNLQNDTIKVVLPLSISDRDLILINPNEYRSIDVNLINKASFKNLSNLIGDYLILSHKNLFDDGNGNNPVQDYATYRSSLQGGSYNTVIFDINEVYDQFGYGIVRHEQAIRNLVHWAKKNWNSQFLFAIGKGVVHTQMRNNPLDKQDIALVPAFGFPSSDNLLAATPQSNIPVMAVGRIAAYTPEMLEQYLDKVKEMELIHQTSPQTIEDKAWMKNVLHLGGGDPDIQNFIKNRLDEMADSIAIEQFGGNVFSLYKNSTDVVQSATSSDVVNFINKGTSLITFFGHSAPNTLDFDIGAPETYTNAGKYPMIYAMGCNTNRLFESRSTLSEKYVFVEDRGAVAFIGSTATTSLSNLNIYGKLFYQNLRKDFYGRTIGEIMQEVIKEYPLGGFWGELVQNNILLHGDPALKFYPHEGPDYLVNISKTQINPSFVNIQSDSFLLELAITNLGIVVEDSLNILIEHEKPNGEKEIVRILKVASPSFEKNYSINIPIIDKNILGQNKLHITLDAENNIEELPSAAELNNSHIRPFIVVSNSAIPVYPQEFSIVNALEKVKLISSTSNAFSSTLSYYLQVDTSSNFNSPLLQNQVIESIGGIVEWIPSSSWQDSTVYFWRISIDSAQTNGNGFDWQTSSFIYIEQSSQGWNQSYTDQKNQITETSLEVLSDVKLFSFLEKELKVTSANLLPFAFPDAAIYVDGFKLFNYFPCPNGGSTESLWATTFDRNTLERTINSNIIYNCFGSSNAVIAFTNDFAERQKAINFLTNEVDDGDYVAIYITQYGTNTLGAAQWAADSITLGTNLFQVLEQEGATKIREMETSESPYIIIYKKGYPNWAGLKELKAVTINDYLEASSTITGRQANGNITSLPIGPSTSWNSLHWDITQKETHDQANIDIIGVTSTGEDSLLITNIQARDTSISYIDAEVFPYIKLRLNLQDTVNRTASQLDYWRVLYDPAPELALRPQVHTVFHADTLEQGDKLDFEIAVENISETDMDSVLVKYVITDQYNNQTEKYERLKPLVKGDSLIASFSYDTRGLSNNNLVTVDVNPDDDQLEQFHFNNIGVRPFFVKQDKRNPLLDVTFDGAHIMNGDLVSASPEIVINLNDENQYLALDDTSLFRIFIQNPEGVTRQYYVDGDTLIFYPADAEDLEEKNEAKLVLNPYFLKDGTYRLQVQARDATGNESGATDYLIDFEVIRENKISYMLNYPNPFSTSTQFVFTLTGERVPDDLRIQIMTVSGDLVREITKEELGDLRIGNNRTSFRWDGTDQYGDKLANGVYLYRMIATMDGEQMDIYNNGTFDYFKSEFGKLVILR